MLMLIYLYLVLDSSVFTIVDDVICI